MAQQLHRGRHAGLGLRLRLARDRLHLILQSGVLPSPPGSTQGISAALKCSVQFMLTSLQKLAFLKNAMNIIDVLAIAPYWISLLILGDSEGGKAGGAEGEGGFGSVSRIMQVWGQY